jgi:hypothetical protein
MEQLTSIVLTPSVGSPCLQGEPTRAWAKGERARSPLLPSPTL